MEDFQEAPPVESLPKVQAVDGTEIPLATLLHIDPESVRNDFEHAASWQATVAYAAGIQKLKVERLKRRVRKLESKTFLALREKLEGKMGKAPSNDLVDHNVRVDPGIEKAWDLYYAEVEKMEALESARFALYARREMLISMGAETRLDRKLND